MIPIRHSPERTPNRALKQKRAKRGETNRQWMKRVQATEGVIFLGGNSLADFRIRVAQSHLRSDLLPSFWSMVGILTDGKTFVSTPLHEVKDSSIVPRTNGVHECALEDFDDPDRYPNIAVVRFAENDDEVAQNVAIVKSQRSIVDLPSLMLAWLGFVWGAGGWGNPLLEGKGLPSAVFVETALGISGIELTPGLASSSSCPEAIWQAAKWWKGFYKKVAEDTEAWPSDVRAIVPSGFYAIRQRAAAVAEH